MRAIVRGKLMPFWEQEVKIPAVNYRGAKKSAGRKLGAEVYNGGLIYPKSNIKSGIPPQARQVKG